MRPRPRAILAACFAGALLLAGCSSSWRPPTASSPSLAAQGHAAQLVFAAPPALDLDPYDDPYLDRRDAALGVPHGSSALQALAYPGQPAPDLYEQRWINLRHTSDQFIYFDRSPRNQWDSWPHHHHDWGW